MSLLPMSCTVSLRSSLTHNLRARSIWLNNCSFSLFPWLISAFTVVLTQLFRLLISGFPAFVVVGAEQKTLHLNLGGWRLWEKKNTALSTGSSIEKGKAFHLICKNESLSYLGSQCYSLQARLFSDLLSDSGLVCALLSAHESCCVVSLVAVCKPLTLHQSAVTHSDPCLGTGPALTMLMAD